MWSRHNLSGNPACTFLLLFNQHLTSWTKVQYPKARMCCHFCSSKCGFWDFFFKGKEQGGRPITSKENHWLPTSIPYCCQWACRNRRWGQAKQFDCSHMAHGKLSFTFLLQSYSVLFQKEKKKRNIHICTYVYIGRGKKQSGGAALLMGDERQALSQLPGVVERRGSSAANPTHPYADT